jgi:hypothetical protein
LASRESGIISGVTLEDLQACDGVCVQLNVGRDIWLATLAMKADATLTDFRPTNEDRFERPPHFPIRVDDRLRLALQRDGKGRLIADAPWLGK